MNQAELPKDWKIVELRNVAQSIGDGMHATPKYSDNTNYYFINGNNLKNGTILVTPKTKTVDEAEYKKHQLGLSERTVLISINGTVGSVSLYRNENVILGKSVCYINCTEILDPTFLFYLLQSSIIKKYFNSELSRTTRSSVANLSLQSIRRMPIILPPLNIQKKIVEKLDYILGELKLKKSLIMDLHQKKLEQISLIQDRLFLSIISKRFDKFNRNEKVPLAKLVFPIETRNPTLKPGQEFEYVEIGSIDQRKKIIESHKRLSGRNAPTRARIVIRTNDVIYALTRPYYRNVALVPVELNDQICSTGFCVLRVTDKRVLNPNFLFYFMLSDQANNQILKAMRGGTYPAVRAKHVMATEIPLIPELEQIQVANQLRKINVDTQIIEERVSQLPLSFKRVLEYIDNLRNGIMHQAFSGKLI